MLSRFKSYVISNSRICGKGKGKREKRTTAEGGKEVGLEGGSTQIVIDTEDELLPGVLSGSESYVP